MEFCIDAAQLRAALAEVEAAEKNGFHHCLAVFKFSHAGYMLQDCRATYADLLERAHPTDRNLNWGRFQAVSRRFVFKDGALAPMQAPPLPVTKVAEWWEKCRENSCWSGAIVGLAWADLWPEAKAEVSELFDAASGVEASDGDPKRDQTPIPSPMDYEGEG